MDAESVLAQARFGHPPSEWNVWPLHRQYVRMSAIKWGLLGLVGFAMFIPTVILTVPSDFVGTSGLEQTFAVVLLALLGAMAFGGAGIAIYDAWRLMRADDYWLIITPESFLKVEPGRITQTPLEDVADLTLKGVQQPGDENAPDVAPASMFSSYGRLLSLANPAGTQRDSRQRVRGSASLAYRDARDKKVVVICTDDSFDHMYALYEILRDRVAMRADEIWRASLRSPRS